MTSTKNDEKKAENKDKQQSFSWPTSPGQERFIESYFPAVTSPGKGCKVPCSTTKDNEVSLTTKGLKGKVSVEKNEKEVNKTHSLVKDKPILIVNETDSGSSLKEDSNKRKGKPSKSKKKREKGKNTPGTKVERSTKEQSTITQHFPVRRSERRTKSQLEKDIYDYRVKRLTTADEEGLEVKVLDEKGRGVFASREFRKDELVCEYAGDLISIEEAKKREAEYSQSTDYGCYMYYFIFRSKKYCVDATKESDRLGRLLNHSKTKCNVHTELFAIKSVPHLILVASRHIAVGEELLYDYGDRSKESIESHPWLKH